MRIDRLQLGRNAPLRAEAILILAVASLAFGGCSAPIEGNEEHAHVGRSIQPIVHGIASGTDQDSVVALARFENGARVGLCTATLVAPNLALTARHCVSVSDAAAACGSDGAPVVGAMLHGDRAPETLAGLRHPERGRARHDGRGRRERARQGARRRRRDHHLQPAISRS